MTLLLVAYVSNVWRLAAVMMKHSKLKILRRHYCSNNIVVVANANSLLLPSQPQLSYSHTNFPVVVLVYITTPPIPPSLLIATVHISIHNL